MKRFVPVALVMLLASGCVALPAPVPLSEEFWNDADKTVAIVVENLPPADFMTTGQQGLLDFAINEGANSALNEYLKQLDYSEFAAVAEEFKELLEAGGATVVAVRTSHALPALSRFRSSGNEKHVYARMDYRPLREELGADRLLLISVPTAGVTRSYYGFIPTSDPMAQLVAEGRVVDLETNRLLWRARMDVTLAIPQPWDEPPSFPNASAAFFKAAEQAKVLLKDDFRVRPAEPAGATDSVAR